MDSVVVNKAELLSKVEENRKTHRTIFEEALEGYRTQILDVLEKHIDRIRTNKPERVSIAIPFPEDHTSDYDTVIAMLKMSVDDTIELSQYDFSSYVLDKWAWKQQFLTNNSYYSATASTMLAQGA